MQPPVTVLGIALHVYLRVVHSGSWCLGVLVDAVEVSSCSVQGSGWLHRTTAADVWDDGEDGHLEMHPTLGRLEPRSQAAPLATFPTGERHM